MNGHINLEMLTRVIEKLASLEERVGHQIASAGKVEGKIDTSISQMTTLGAQVTDLGKKVDDLVKWRHRIAGVGLAVGALLTGSAAVWHYVGPWIHFGPPDSKLTAPLAEPSAPPVGTVQVPAQEPAQPLKTTSRQQHHSG
ncbi:hypothetical protein DYGSA30_26430 [Dyella sp. GSA-30]|nr:hypothetical protein DYGSA30_26430 [Dyella sp. GSA-30]